MIVIIAAAPGDGPEGNQQKGTLLLLEEELMLDYCFLDELQRLLGASSLGHVYLS